MHVWCVVKRHDGIWRFQCFYSSAKSGSRIQIERLYEDNVLVSRLDGRFLNRDLQKVYCSGTRQEGLYGILLKSMYVILEASMMWYQKLKLNLDGNRFKFNPYDACIFNRIGNNKQPTVIYYVEDILLSHADPKVNDNFQQWLDLTFWQL